MIKPWLARQFQFHKGTIKTVGSFMRGVRVMNFNSIKVQLRLSCQYRL